MMPIAPHVLAALPQAIGRPYRAEWSNDGGITWQPCGLVAQSAQITAARTGQTRYTAQAEVVGVGEGRDGINTISSNIRLLQGAQLPRQDPLWFAAGRYSVTRTARTKNGGISLELDGLESDLDDPLPVPRTVGPALARTLVQDLVGEALPGVPVAWREGIDPDTVVPQVVAADTRWAVLSSGTDSTGASTGIAAALGGEIWADARGIITVGPVPTLDDPVVWSIGRGTGGALVEPRSESTRDGLINVWAVSGDGGDGSEAVGPAFAWDDDPNSLTYAGPDPIGDPGAPQRLGLYGVRARTERHSSSLITSYAQALQVARAKLADSLGMQASLSLTTVCNPALEPGDVVAVEVEAGVWQRHIIDSLSYTLGAASMSCTTRTSSRRL